MKLYGKFDVNGKLQSYQYSTMSMNDMVEIIGVFNDDDIPFIDKVDNTFIVNTAEKNAYVVNRAMADFERDQNIKYGRRYAFAQNIKVKIARLNESKGWGIAATQAYLSDTTVQQINALISDVSFVSAKAIIAGADLSAYYTASEKQSIVDMIDNYLVNEG